MTSGPSIITWKVFEGRFICDRYDWGVYVPVDLLHKGGLRMPTLSLSLSRQTYCIVLYISFKYIKQPKDIGRKVMMGQKRKNEIRWY